MSSKHPQPIPSKKKVSTPVPSSEEEFTDEETPAKQSTTKPKSSDQSTSKSKSRKKPKGEMQIKLSKGIITPHRMPGNYGFAVDALENMDYLGTAMFFTETNLTALPELFGFACEQYDAFKLKKGKPKAGGTEAYAEMLE